MFPFVTGHSWKYGPTKTAKTSPQKITSVCTDRKSFAIIRTIWMKYPKNKTSAFRVKIENERFTFDFSCCRQNLKIIWWFDVVVSCGTCSACSTIIFSLLSNDYNYYCSWKAPLGRFNKVCMYVYCCFVAFSLTTASQKSLVVYHLPKKSGNFGWNVNGKPILVFPNG